MSDQDRMPDRVISPACSGLPKSAQPGKSRAPRRSPLPPLLGVLLASCMTITQPPNGGNVVSPVVAKVDVGNVCGTPFRAMLDGVDVTAQFSPSAPSSTTTQA